MKTYQRRERIPMVRLTKADVVRLTRIVTEHAPGEGYVAISTTLGDGLIEATSLDAFLAHEDLPPVLDNLSITGSKDGRTVGVALGGPLAMLEITSNDDVWVRGNYDRLREFLHRHRRIEAPRILASGLLISVVAGGVVTLTTLLVSQGAIAYGLIASIAGMYLLFRYITWAMLPGGRTTQIWLIDKPTFWRGILTTENLNIAIAILALIFTIIQTLR